VPLTEVRDDAAQFLFDGSARVVAPWIEIGEDSLETSCAVLAEMDRQLRSLHGLFLEKSSVLSISSHAAVEDSEEDESLALYAHSPAVLTICLASLSPALMPAMGPTIWPVLICGSGVPLKFFYLLTSGVLAWSALKNYTAWPNQEERGVQEKAALAMLTSSSLHLGLVCFGVPSIIDHNFISGELVLQYCVELVANPLLILNVRHIAGTDEHIAMSMVANAAGSSLMILASMHAAPWHLQMALFSAGAFCLAEASRELNTVPYKAVQPRAPGDPRPSQSLTDLMILSWVARAGLEGLALTKVVGPSEVACVILFIDFLSKLATCNRSVKLLGPRHGWIGLPRLSRQSVLTVPISGPHASESDTESTRSGVSGEHGSLTGGIHRL